MSYLNWNGDGWCLGMCIVLGLSSLFLLVLLPQESWSVGRVIVQKLARFSLWSGLCLLFWVLPMSGYWKVLTAVFGAFIIESSFGVSYGGSGNEEFHSIFCLINFPQLRWPGVLWQVLITWFDQTSSGITSIGKKPSTWWWVHWYLLMWLLYCKAVAPIPVADPSTSLLWNGIKEKH